MDVGCKFIQSSTQCFLCINSELGAVIQYHKNFLSLWNIYSSGGDGNYMN
jgi:hypothetical protein